MKIRTHREGECQVVAVQGSADIAASAELREALLGPIESGVTCVVCDMRGADFVGSDALGVLIMAHLKARSRGGFLRLAGPQEHLKDVLKTTRLDRLFDVFPDVPAALQQR